MIRTENRKQECHRCSKKFVARGGPFHVVEIIELDARDNILEGGARIFATYVTAQDSQTNCYKGREEKETKHCLTWAEAYSVI